jgi:hypothetical protein
MSFMDTFSLRVTLKKAAREGSYVKLGISREFDGRYY